MTTFLDLLVVVVMVMAAVGLLATALMFLVKNRTVQRICFYPVIALGMYLGYVGFRINGFGFDSQAGLAVLLALVSFGALVLERLSKGSEKRFLIAKIAASASLVAGMLNAFIL